VLDFIDEANATIHELHSFMLLRHGQVAAEGWWAPYTPKRPHTLFSLTKSFTSTAVGLAVSEGLLSIDDPVLGFFPDEAPEKPGKNLQAMRVRHLLSMVTGHTDDSTEAAVTDPDGNWVRGFLAKPVEHAPGAPFVYNSGASHMLSAIVQKVSGQRLQDYLAPRLFEPLGIRDAAWESDPRGINTGGWGLHIKTEDIARFGQLYLQRGLWEGQQIVPTDWVDMAGAKQVDNDVNPDTGPEWRQGYGFQFWRCRHNAYRGDGAFGQYCIILPDQDAVIAITSGVGDMQAVMDLVWKHLLPAMKPDPLPEDQPSQDALFKKLAGLCLEPPSGSPSSPDAEKVSGKTYCFADNPLELKSLAFEFSPEGASLAFEDQAGKHVLACEFAEWKTAESTFFPQSRRHGIFTPPVAYPVVAAFAWTAEDTLEVQVRYYETPFFFTFSCKFDQDQVDIEARVNVSFGPTELPTLKGVAT